MPRLPGRVRVGGEYVRPRLGGPGRAGVHGGAPGLHHRAPVRLLVVGGADHPDLAVDAVLRAGEGQRAAPLPGAGLGGEPLGALGRVVVRLRDGGVRLVRPGRRHALVLVVDPRRGVQRLLQPVRPVQRGGPPQPVDVQHLVRDGDVGVGRHFLADQLHREQRREILRAHRLARPRVQRRGRRRGQVGDHVVPPARDLGLIQSDLGALTTAGSAKSNPAPTRRWHRRPDVNGHGHGGQYEQPGGDGGADEDVPRPGPEQYGRADEEEHDDHAVQVAPGRPGLRLVGGQRGRGGARDDGGHDHRERGHDPQVAPHVAAHDYQQRGDQADARDAPAVEHQPPQLAGRQLEHVDNAVHAGQPVTDLAGQAARALRVDGQADVVVQRPARGRRDHRGQRGHEHAEPGGGLAPEDEHADRGQAGQHDQAARVDHVGVRGQERRAGRVRVPDPRRRGRQPAVRGQQPGQRDHHEDRVGHRVLAVEEPGGDERGHKRHDVRGRAVEPEPAAGQIAERQHQRADHGVDHQHGVVHGRGIAGEPVDRRDEQRIADLVQRRTGQVRAGPARQHPRRDQVRGLVRVGQRHDLLAAEPYPQPDLDQPAERQQDHPASARSPGTRRRPRGAPGRNGHAAARVHRGRAGGVPRATLSAGVPRPQPP